MSSNEGHDPNPANPGPTGDPTSPDQIPPKTPGGKDDGDTGNELPAQEVTPSPTRTTLTTWQASSG